MTRARQGRPAAASTHTTKTRARKPDEFATVNGGTPEYIWLREQLLRLQENKCPVCGVGLRNADFDHHHDTGAPRGALCKPCNGALGIPENAHGTRVSAVTDWELKAGIRAIPPINARARARLDGLPKWPDNARAYFKKWAPIVEDMGAAYRRLFGAGMRPISIAKGAVPLSAFVEIGNVLVRQSQRVRAGMTTEQIREKQAARPRGWLADWKTALGHPDENGNWRGEADGWTWDRFTRVIHVMLMALDWYADISWTTDYHAQPRARWTLLLMANIGQTEAGGGEILWGIGHRESMGATFNFPGDVAA